MSDAYYTLHIAGLERQLKRFPVSDSMDIAAFIFFGDVELTKACAEALLKKVPEFDYIVTPEAKSIPLAYEMSRQSGKKYIVARKGVKVYMDRPEKVTVHSITTQKEQTLYLGHNIHRVRGHQENAVKAAGNNGLHNGAENLVVFLQQIPTTLTGQLGCTGTDHNQICVAAVAVLPCLDFHGTGRKGQAVRQIRSLAPSTLLVDVDEYQLIANILVQQRISKAHTYHTNAYNGHFFLI